MLVFDDDDGSDEMKAVAGHGDVTVPTYFPGERLLNIEARHKPR
jgi:hypothetical protein